METTKENNWSNRLLEEKVELHNNQYEKEKKYDPEIIVGDVRKEIKKIDDNSIHLIITSPPYWNCKDYQKQGQIGSGQTYNGYHNEMNKVWKECIRVLKPNGKLCINIMDYWVRKDDNKDGFPEVLDMIGDIRNFVLSNGMRLKCKITWWKKATGVLVKDKAPNHTLLNNAEWIYVFVKPGKPEKEELQTDPEELREYRDNVWVIQPVMKINANQMDGYGHAAPFPEELPRRLIKLFSLKENIVLDPFLGSGTTCRVAKEEERRSIGYELNENFLAGMRKLKGGKK